MIYKAIKMNNRQIFIFLHDLAIHFALFLCAARVHMLFLLNIDKEINAVVARNRIGDRH